MPFNRHPDREYLPIPQQKTPEKYICFCLFMPDNPEHFAAFWGALNALSEQYTWGKPLSTDSKLVADYWADILRENRRNFEEVIK